MDLPRGYTHAVFICCVATPESLDEVGSWLSPPDHVLLPLLLLNLQRESWPQNTLEWTPVSQSKSLPENYSSDRRVKFISDQNIDKLYRLAKVSGFLLTDSIYNITTKKNKKKTKRFLCNWSPIMVKILILKIIFKDYELIVLFFVWNEFYIDQSRLRNSNYLKDWRGIKLTRDYDTRLQMRI